MRARPLESDWSAAALPRPDDRTDGRTADGCDGGRGRSAAARRIVGCRPARGGGKTGKWRRRPGRRPPGRGGGGGVEKGRPSLARAHTNGRSSAAAVETAAAAASCAVFSLPRRPLLYVRPSVVALACTVTAHRSLSVALTTLVHNKLHNIREEKQKKKKITSVSFSPPSSRSLVLVRRAGIIIIYCSVLLPFRRRGCYLLYA